MPRWSGRTWQEHEVVWGVTLCHVHADPHPAEALLDGLPLCIDGADELLERIAAVELAPALRELLPPLDGT